MPPSDRSEPPGQRFLEPVHVELEDVPCPTADHRNRPFPEQRLGRGKPIVVAVNVDERLPETKEEEREGFETGEDERNEVVDGPDEQGENDEEDRKVDHDVGRGGGFPEGRVSGERGSRSIADGERKGKGLGTLVASEHLDPSDDSQTSREMQEGS